MGSCFVLPARGQAEWTDKGLRGNQISTGLEIYQRGVTFLKSPGSGLSVRSSTV